LARCFRDTPNGSCPGHQFPSRSVRRCERPGHGRSGRHRAPLMRPFRLDTSGALEIASRALPCRNDTRNSLYSIGTSWRSVSPSGLMAPASDQTTQMTAHVSIGSGCRSWPGDLFDDSFSRPIGRDGGLHLGGWPQGFQNGSLLKQWRLPKSGIRESRQSSGHPGVCIMVRTPTAGSGVARGCARLAVLGCSTEHLGE